MRPSQNRSRARKKPLIWLILAVTAIFALSAPLYTSPFMLRVLQMFFFSVGLALSWNILGGYAGYWSFGHTVFIGIGAFVAGKLALIHRTPHQQHVAFSPEYRRGRTGFLPAGTYSFIPIASIEGNLFCHRNAGRGRVRR